MQTQQINGLELFPLLTLSLLYHVYNVGLNLISFDRVWFHTYSMVSACMSKKEDVTSRMKRHGITNDYIYKSTINPGNGKGRYDSIW